MSGIREYLNKPYGISRKGFVKMKYKSKALKRIYKVYQERKLNN